MTNTDRLPPPAQNLSPTATRHIPALDGVRGLAILLVMVYHFTSPLGFSTRIENAVLTVAHQGWIGVELFFVLSGFLITGILLENRDAARENVLVNFYARRVLRIFPLYYGVVLLVLLLGMVIPAMETEGYRRFTGDQGWFWCYAVNIGRALRGPAAFYYGSFDFTHFWTLAVEEHFYLVWPWLVLGARNRRAILLACLILFLISLGFRVWVACTGESTWPLALTASVRQAGSLLLGACVAILLRDAAWTARLAKFAPATGIFASIAGMVLLLVFPRALAWPVPVFAPILFGVAFASLIVLLVAGRPGLLQAGFEIRPLIFLGKYSYALYVFHHLLYPQWIWLLDVYHRVFGIYRLAALMMIVTAAAISIGLSLLSWIVFEQPILRLKRYFRYTDACLPRFV